MPARAVRKITDETKAKATTVPADSLQALEDDASLVAGLADVMHEQIDEYVSALDDLVEKVTGRHLFGPGSLVETEGRYDTLNRKNSAIYYLLTLMQEKAEAVESRVFTLRDPRTAPIVPTPVRKPRARTAKRRAA